MAMLGNFAPFPQSQYASACSYSSVLRHDYGALHDDERIIASEWTSAWNAGSVIGMMLGSLAGGILFDRHGRRFSLGPGSLSSSIGVAVI